MHIVAFQASNFKKLQAVIIRPGQNGEPVIIAGNNAQGKSSVLDGIWATLGGGDASREIVMPIRAGQERADVQIDLGSVVATRTWTGNDTSYLKLTQKDGTPIAQPQTFLNGLFGNLTFDPLAFARQEPREQREELLKIAGVDQARIAALNASQVKVFDDRADAKKKLKEMESELALIPLLPDAPAAPIVLDESRAAATEAERTHNAQEADKSTYMANKARIEKLRKEMQGLEDENKVLLERWKDYKKPDVDALWATVKNAEELNRRYAQNQRHLELEKQILDQKQRVQDFDRSLDAHENEKGKVLAAAAMPVPDLSVSEDEVLYRGIPYSQLSTAEKLRVALAIAMSGEKELKVVLIRDASLLDPQSMAVAEAMAAERGYQLWMEIVGPDERGFIIEEGKVIGTPAQHG